MKELILEAFSVNPGGKVYKRGYKRKYQNYGKVCFQA